MVAVGTVMVLLREVEIYEFACCFCIIALLLAGQLVGWWWLFVADYSNYIW